MELDQICRAGKDTEKDFDVLVYDLRNHGLSDSGKISYEHYVSDISDIIKKENINDIILMGNCYGSNIALLVNERVSNRVKEMVLISLYTPNLMKFKTIMVFLGLLGMKRFKNKNRKKRYQDLTKHKKISDLVYPFLSLKNTNVSTYLRSIWECYKNPFEIKINKPTLVISSEEDFVVSVPKLEKFFSENEKVTFKIIRETDHLDVFRKPELFVKEIRNFLKY